MEKENERNQNIRWYDLLICVFCFFIIIAYILFSSGTIINDMQNPLSNALFALFNIISTLFIAYKISIVYESQRNYKHQRRLVSCQA